ncbi:hypothetical protein B296_00008612 [Ensete ventricosum]|uniref:Ariadne domain-containing protein n=1 Tax=Ensete ventricosum TaxID=4639 RepID=A0A427A3V6_ENSVE|nr:hypothetical protein B296_00008612 [Ensete ventricosum]
MHEAFFVSFDFMVFNSWLCGGATGRDHTWSSISGHSCGRFKEDQAKRTERARRDLYRYMHYHNRYKAHTDSLKQESNLKETIQGKISISENKESKIKDYTWVINGLNRLFRSRRVLSYSYPFAFYMFGDELFKDEMTPQERDMKQNLFEDQQQQLEANVEKLSMFLEKDFQHFTDDEVMDIMRHVINLSNVSSCNGFKLNAGAAVPSKRASSSSDESGCSSHKRARTEAHGAAPLFDLNMPAEVIDKS